MTTLLVQDSTTSVYALPTEPAPDMSARYVNIDSNIVIEQMRDNGYAVASIRRNNTRTSRGFYARHMIDFRRPEDAKLDPEVSPRILFINSHDGSTRARLTSGLIRWICSNGMIAGSILSDHKVTHIGLEATKILEHVSTLSKDSLVVFDQIEQLRKTVMSKSEIIKFAGEAAVLRFGEKNANNYDPLLISAPRRHEDVKNDLWTVFNRIQENAIRGGLPTISTAARQVSRPITNIDKDLKLNQDLWNLAMTYAQ